MIRLTNKIIVCCLIKHMEFIDLRSDTVTHPTTKMKQEILTAEIGDQVYGEDPNVLVLEQLAASIMGKQAASFVPSGTFGNQCTILTLAAPYGEILISEKSHLVDYEQGSSASIARMLTRTVETDDKMLMRVQTVSKLIRKVQDKQAPRTVMFQIENPTGIGSVYPIDHFNALIDIAKKNNLHVHIDGARIFNACEFLQITPKQLLKDCDTVMFCLNKGLCCPIGSLVVGSKQFIDKFNINKKMLGGAIRKPGMFASMGIIALKQMTQHLKDDHRIAQLLAKQLSQIQWIRLIREPQTTMIFFRMVDAKMKGCEQKLEQWFLQRKIKCVLDQKFGADNRFVVHHYIREQQISRIIKGLNQFYQSNITNQ